jgi:protein phosphatase
MVIAIQEPSLVLLIGPSGSGKSTFAQRHFQRTEVLSSDFCRALVCDDESNQAATDDAFEVLHLILSKRLNRRHTTVIDATNVQTSSRERLTTFARQANIPLVAIVFSLPQEILQARNLSRTHRQVKSEVIQQQLATMAESIGGLYSEGFESIFTINSAEELDAAIVIRSHS